jgi:HD-GYP domain-containing protein (c-di-GMP phosphodiesterase class II)
LSEPKKTRREEGGAPPQARRLKLQQLLFLLVLVPSILPLLISSFHLIDRNRDILKAKETELLAQSAQVFVDRLSEDLARRREQLHQVGRSILAPPGSGTVHQRLQEPWVSTFLLQIVEDPGLLSFYALDQNGRGLHWGNEPNANVEQTLREAFDASLRTGRIAYRFTVLSQLREPAVAIAVPIPAPSGDDALVMQALVKLAVGTSIGTDAEIFDKDDFFLVDIGGKMLWSGGSQPDIEAALLASDLVKDFASVPELSVTQDYDLEIKGRKVPTLARVVQVHETGWGVVAHKARDEAFRQVQALVWDIALSSAFAIALALFFAVIATRWFSQPIARLAETSHEIAAGNFDRRMPVEGVMTEEIAEMANDFNRMSDYLERYIEQLRKAAEANRSLFISSIRAFAAAIDAKDPYTRGHSERVAAYSRAIAFYMGLPKDIQEKVWISGVLHDVGKIGVQDSVLQKHGVLTPDEFDQMKTHPAIGAEIVEPIGALRDMIPGIRWHHEAWNGAGYPDRLKGEQIPLMARIIGVADTFDAITTNRPYQTASPPEFAIETIKKLTGTKFDARVVTAFLLAWEAGQIRLERARADEASQGLQTPDTARLLTN